MREDNMKICGRISEIKVYPLEVFIYADELSLHFVFRCDRADVECEGHSIDSAGPGCPFEATVMQYQTWGQPNRSIDWFCTAIKIKIPIPA